MSETCWEVQKRSPLHPEDYPDINKLSILGDVAPYSREYNRIRAVVEKQSHGDTDLRAQYEQIVEQVRQTKESTLQVDERRFDAPVDRIEGTVKTASFKGIELSEYPGRIFHFSSVGSSMADLVADLLGKSNAMTRAEASKVADSRLRDRDQYLSGALAEGTQVSLTIGRGAAENAENIRAVIEAGGVNINRELIDQGYGRFRKDLSIGPGPSPRPKQNMPSRAPAICPPTCPLAASLPGAPKLRLAQPARPELPRLRLSRPPLPATPETDPHPASLELAPALDSPLSCPQNSSVTPLKSTPRKLQKNPAIDTPEFMSGFPHLKQGKSVSPTFHWNL